LLEVESQWTCWGLRVEGFEWYFDNWDLLRRLCMHLCKDFAWRMVRSWGL